MKARLTSIILFLILALAVFLLVRHQPGSFLIALPKPPNAPLAVTPPTKAAPPEVVSRIPDQRTAIGGALRCLNDICDTGASDDAISEARSLIEQLDTTTQPFARDFSVVLKSVLSCRGDSADQATVTPTPIPGYPAISTDLIDRAASACSEKNRRNPGEIVLSFAGDCTFGTVNGDDSPIRFPSLYRRSGLIDYPFALMAPWFRNDDLTIVNFECTLTDARQTADKEWHFKGPARYASIFPAGSVEVAGLANNHSFDYLQTGFDDTVANFKNAHVPVFYQNHPYVTTLKGVETVIIGDCTVVGENTTVIDGAPERVLAEIRRYKKPDNIVVVVMHWGSELDTVPRTWQQEMGRKFIDAGADAVVGAHPHVVQGIENYKGKTIAYSLGNFAFGGNSLAHFPETFVLRLRFRVIAGKTNTVDTSIVPCWVTSTHARNEAGVLRNNYQPMPVFGQTADHTASLVLHRSAGLQYGVKRVGYLRLRMDFDGDGE